MSVDLPGVVRVAPRLPNTSAVHNTLSVLVLPERDLRGQRPREDERECCRDEGEAQQSDQGVFPVELSVWADHFSPLSGRRYRIAHRTYARKLTSGRVGGFSRPR